MKMINKLILISILFLAIPLVNAQCHGVDPKCEGLYPSDYACNQNHIVTGFCDNNCYYHPSSGVPVGECYNSGRGTCTADYRCHLYLPYSQGSCPVGYYCNGDCQCFFKDTTTTTTPLCTDSDGGKNYLVKGTCNNGTSISYADYCTYSSQLVEYYCAGSNCLSEIKYCPSLGSYYCNDGRCIFLDTTPATTTSTTTISTTTTIKPQPTTIRRPLRGAGGSRWAIPLGTSEVLNNPFVIVTSIIVILIIAAGIFGSLKMISKKRR
jgi:hypothetical protein